MVLFIDLDGVLGELRYKDKIVLSQNEGDTCDDICSGKFKEPTLITDYLNKTLKSKRVFILTNLPKSKISAQHIRAKREGCKKNLKFDYVDVVINEEGFSKYQKARQIIEKDNIMLIDDSMSNLYDGENHGGIAFHVSSLLTKSGRELFERKIK